MGATIAAKAEGPQHPAMCLEPHSGRSSRLAFGAIISAIMRPRPSLAPDVRPSTGAVMPDQNLLYYGDNLDIPSLYQRRDGRSGLPLPAAQKRSVLQRPIRLPPRCTP